MTEIKHTILLDDQSSLGSDPPESEDSDAQINDELDQQIRLPVKRRSELHGDTTLNHKRMKPSTTFNTEGVSGNARIVNVGRDHITQVADGREATARATIYDWLSSLDVSQNYNAARRRHQPGTDSWFITGKQFVDWKEHPETILCIYGDPGSGKTILCSSVIEDVKEMCKSQASSVYAYFFFDSRNADSRLLLYENLLRSLLSQISDRRDGIPDAVKEMYRTHRDGREQPSLKSVHEALRQVIDEFDGHVYIIIDSLDECGDRAELLEWIKTVAEWNSTKVHLLLTSRLEPAITDQLDALTRICPVRLQGSTLEDDIAVYLDERLSKLVNRWSDIMCALIKSTLMTRADGMFRWVALQIDDLQRCLTAGEVKEQLKRLPRDLEETYERILSRSPRRRDLSQMLHWLAFSQCALSLDAIAEVVSVDLDAEDGPRYDSDLKYEDAKTALEVCSGLVTEIDGTVKLAHFSVKEYLLSEHIRAGAAAFFGISANISHSVIARTCLTYLLIFSELDSVQVPVSAIGHFPLHSYAAIHAPFHIQSVGNEACPSLEMLLLNMFASTRNPALVHWIRIRHPQLHVLDQFDLWLGYQICEVAQPLYYAALLGLKQVVERLLQEGADPNQLGGAEHTALQVASCFNHSEVVQLLVKHGANVNAQTGDHMFRPSTENALHAAVSHHYAETVAVLLELGANVNIQSNSYGTPLIDAAATGSSEIVRLLLEGGADIHLHGTDINNHPSALHAAVVSCDIETLKLLFKWGADVNAHKGMRGSALQSAASWSFGANIEVVKMLLEHGADVNFLGGIGRTALEAAASHEDNADVLALLLEWGADINLQSAYGTALQAAIQRRHLDNIKLLFKHGADINLQGGGSVLQSAAAWGSTEVIQLILDKGADINIQGDEFGTALNQAAWRGKDAAVVLLLERGANVNLLGDHGSALHGAAEGGNAEIVKLLLERGANVNVQGPGYRYVQRTEYGYVQRAGYGYGSTPLHYASRLGHTETAKLLLEWGAGANVRARSGTALHEARNAQGIAAKLNNCSLHMVRWTDGR